MGLFSKWKAPDETGVSKFDRLNVLGASMRDDPQALAATMQMLQAQQKQSLARQQLGARNDLAALFQPTSTAPIAPIGDFQGSGPETAKQRSLRDMAPALAQAAARGVDITDFISLADKASPRVEVANGVAYDPTQTVPGQRIGVNLANVNGFQVDQQDPANAGKFMPKIADGAVPLYDAQGNVVAQRNLDGTVQALAEQAGATAAAEARARAPYDFVTPQGPDGAPIFMSKAQAAGVGPISGQSPAQQAAATITAEAGANAQVRYPQALATATETLGLIDKLRTHPGRQRGTGFTGFLPSIPGSAKYDFDVLNRQAQGKVFLEAFASLKGAGAVTEREGQAATDAMARMDKAQSEQAYLDALTDLERVLQGSVQRMQQQAGARASGRPSGRPARAEIEAELRRRGLL